MTGTSAFKIPPPYEASGAGYVNEKWEDIIREWRAVMYAKTEADYATAWEQFQTVREQRARLTN